MVLGLHSSRQVVLQQLLHAAPWLMCGVSIILIAAIIRAWIPIWSNAEGHGIGMPVLAQKSSPQFATKASSLSTTRSDHSDRGIIPWFGTFKPNKPEAPPPPEAIEISQRNLHLVGISTSTSPNESFALIKSANGIVKALKTGDAAEPGVELVELLPNAAILKAGDHWEKLYLGDPPPGIARSVTGGIPGRNNGSTQTAQPGSDTMTISGMRPGTEISADSKPHRNDNPNLSNRDIRERMNALMATLQQ